MNYIGIDIHKRSSICAAQNERGWLLGEARIEGNSVDGFVQYFAGLSGRSKVVIEACENGGKLYDLFEVPPQVTEVVLAHPLKTRLIANAQIHAGGVRFRIFFDAGRFEKNASGDSSGLCLPFVIRQVDYKLHAFAVSVAGA